MEKYKITNFNNASKWLIVMMFEKLSIIEGEGEGAIL